MVAGRGKDALAALKQTSGKLAMYAAQNPDDARATGLAGDVQGRCLKAISTPERFARWGERYLRAIVRAHELELCTNFLDFGLQHYGGALFKSLVKAGGELFVSIPLKKTSDYNAMIGGYQPASQAAAAAGGGAAPAANAQVYYGGGGGGCFAGHSVVQVRDGSRKRIADIRKGDVVEVAGGWAEVVLAAELQAPSHLVHFVDCGLGITPKHPIWMQSEWVRPLSCVDGVSVLLLPNCDPVYNFVLTSDHRMIVNGVACVTWSHGLAGAAAHPVYGTSRVLEVLQKAPGYDTGFVRIASVK